MEVLFQLNPNLRRCNNVSVFIKYLDFPGFILSLVLGSKPHSVNEKKAFFRVLLVLWTRCSKLYKLTVLHRVDYKAKLNINNI